MLSVSEMNKNLNSGSSLTPPPAPGTGFDDIKNEVSQVPAPSSMKEKLSIPDEKSLDDTASLEEPSPLGMSPEENSSEEKGSFDLNDDSLFDFSDVGLDTKAKTEANESSSPSFDLDDQASQDLSFAKAEREVGRSSPTNSYFVTTQQYRTMLEIIENVKSKVKEAHDTHVRLTDIKAEEDIEFENLRKDFQFVEDKLYELDSIIFER
jgi:hypothetical protein